MMQFCVLWIIYTCCTFVNTGVRANIEQGSRPRSWKEAWRECAYRNADLARARHFRDIPLYLKPGKSYWSGPFHTPSMVESLIDDILFGSEKCYLMELEYGQVIEKEEKILCNDPAEFFCVTTDGSEILPLRPSERRTNENSSSEGNDNLALLGLIGIVPLSGIIAFIIIKVKRSRNANSNRTTAEQPIELQCPFPDHDRMDAQNAPEIYEEVDHPDDQSRNSQPLVPVYVEILQ